VPKDDRHGRLERAVDLVQVGVAQPGVLDPDQDLLGSRVVEEELLDLQLSGRAVEDRGRDAPAHTSSK